MSKQINKILWAVDAFEDTDQRSPVLFTLGAFGRASQASIEPVFVLSTSSAQVPVEPFGLYQEAFSALAEKRLRELSARIDLPITHPKILLNAEGSTRKDVETLLKYAESASADLIVVSTHARRGLSRMMLGSFAETLVLYSKIPVVTVNPETHVREKISKILFPTNFYERFRESFDQVISLAKNLDASVVLYYKEPIIPYSYMAGDISAYLAKEAEDRQERAEQWKAMAASRGVAAEVRLDETPGNLIEGLREISAQGKIDLIAMATQAAPVLSAILGSTTRQLVREAACPVWVMHSRV